MKHAANDDDEQDTSNDDNANGMGNQWFEGACCENVLQILPWLFQNLGFEAVRINLGWWAQWEVRPCKLEQKRLKHAHEPLSEPRSPATRSPGPPLPPADLKNEDCH